MNATAEQTQSYSLQRKSLFILFLICFSLFYGAYFYQSWQNNGNQNKVEMKSGGKHGKHSNPKARQSADEKYQEAKTEFEKLNSKIKKTPEEKAELEK